MAFSSIIAKAIKEYSGNLFNENQISKVAKEVDEEILYARKQNQKDFEPTDDFESVDDFAMSDMSPDYDLEDYIERNVRVAFREKNEKPLEELQQLPEYEGYSEGVEGGWQAFSRARGYDEEEIENFEEMMELKDIVDKYGDYSSAISVGLNDIVDKYFYIQRKGGDNDTIPQKYNKFIPVLREQFLTNEDYEDYLTPEGAETAARNALLEFLEDTDSKRILDDMLDELPKPRQYPQQSFDNMRGVSAEEFVADSVEKEPKFFRGVTSFNDLNYDLSFIWPREIGTHVGNLGQASSIIARKVNAGREDMYIYKEGEMPTAKEMSEFFQDEGQRLKESSVFEEGIQIPPSTMMKGYIKTKNPLVLEQDFGSWDPVDILTNPLDTQVFFDAIEAQGVKISDEQDLIFSDLAERADFIQMSGSFEGVTQGRELENLKIKLLGTQLGKEFRQWLEGLGFDSIKYRNTFEASLENETPYSYLLFRPEQYKSYTATDFDPNRPAFAEGGYVIKSGDTLSQIAKDNNTTVAEIARLNNIEDANKIYAGQKLTLDEQVKEAKEPVKKRKGPRPTKAKEAIELEEAPPTQESAWDFAKQFVSGMLRTGEKTTENFSNNLVSVLKETAINAAREGRNYIDYGDYPKTAVGQSPAEWVHGNRDWGDSEGFTEKAKSIAADPVLNTALTIGRGNLVRENGRVFLEDIYDFSKIPGGLFEDASGKTRGAYGIIRKVAGEIFPYTSFLGEANRIKIDLGPEEEIYGRPEVVMDQQDTDTQEV